MPKKAQKISRKNTKAGAGAATSTTASLGLQWLTVILSTLSWVCSGQICGKER